MVDAWESAGVVRRDVHRGREGVGMRGYGLHLRIGLKRIFYDMEEFWGSRHTV